MFKIQDFDVEDRNRLNNYKMRSVTGGSMKNEIP